MAEPQRWGGKKGGSKKNASEQGGGLPCLGEERPEEEELQNKQWSDKRPLSPQEKKGPGKHLIRDSPHFLGL